MIDRLTGVRLTVAAAISGAAHAAFITFGRIDVPQAPSDLPPLAVRVERAPEPAHPPAEIRPAKRPRMYSQASPVLVPRVPSALAASSEAEASESGAHDEARVEEASAPPPLSEPTVLATAPQASEIPEPPRARSLPRKGRITYNLVYGRDQFPVGRTIQTWEVNGERYILASRSETTGIVDLVRSQHRTFLSRGSVTRNGLRPDLFVMSRNRGRGTEEAKATFDWSEASVTLGAAATERQESLPARTQDLLSFMYQLSVDPPPHGRFRQALTNGSRLETHEVEVLAEETIDTPLGALRALPVRQVRKPGSESLDLWLAPEYRYLPVRIRFFNREGEPQGEQIVTEIRVSDE